MVKNWNLVSQESAANKCSNFSISGDYLLTDSLELLNLNFCVVILLLRFQNLL